MVSFAHFELISVDQDYHMASCDAIAAQLRDAGIKVKRTIIRDCLNGENGRAKVTSWVPKWMAFPPAVYTERGGVE